jgi:hypothetical protein
MSTNITSGLEQWVRDTAAQSERAGSASANLRKAIIMPVDLGYTPFPKQQQFHGSPAKYRLFGGAAGPGKSKALLMEAILQADDHPGANTLLLRRTFSELEQSLLLYFRRDVPRELYKSFNDSKHVVTWHNGSTTRFGYCLAENDVYQYQGAEFLFIGIDELTLFTLRQWQFLTSRNRCPVPGAFPCMAAATNPGNIGHAWVKALWIDKQSAPGMENPGEYDPADYDFIPARVTDNPIYAADENYLKTLRALPSHLKRAFLDGDWDVFAGQYFDKFDTTRHIVRPEAIDWKPWWPRWISIDWGYEHYAATYWHAAIPASAAVGERHPERSPAPFSSRGVSAARDAVEGPLLDAAATSASIPAAPGNANLPIGSSNANPSAASSRANAAPAPFVGAQHAVPGDNTRRDARHPATAQGDALDVEAGTAAANITTAGALTSRHSERSVPSSLLREAPGRAVEESLFDPAAPSASNPAASPLSCHPEPGRISGRCEGSAFSLSGEDQKQIPRTPSRAPAEAGESRKARATARDDSSRAGGSVEGQGFSPDINDRAKRDTQVEGRDFSPAVNDRREAPSSLPKAVAEGECPERHGSNVDASTAPNPAANIADENRRREEAAPKFPRRPRSWLGFAGTIPGTPPESPASTASRGDENSRCVVSYREYVTHRTPPRELAREIVRRSVQSTPSLVGAQHAVPGADTWRDANRPPTSGGGASSSAGRSFSSDINDVREAPSSLPKAVAKSEWTQRHGFSSSASAPEKIDAIYLSPDAFARRTDEASIAEQMGDIFVAAGLPRPIPADDDRIGGWMLMYQMLDAGEWLLTENCTELIRTLPNLIRDPARIEDIEKMDGDDAADAARYGLKSRYGAHRVAGEHRMPLTDRIAARVVSDDPTIRAMQARKAQVEESRGAKPVKFPHRRRPHR